MRRPVGLALLLCLSGCRHAPRSVPTVKAAPEAASPFPANLPLPTDLSRAQLKARIVDGLRRRIRGRRDSYRDIERVATETAPLVREAAQQPQVQPVFTRMAEAEGIPASEARARWIALQEADLLLESGGDPDAVSVADAVGVAQWLAGTGRGAGLRVNLAESERLSKKVLEEARRIAWLEYLRRPDADPRALGAPTPTPADYAGLPALKADLVMLRAKRRSIDGRYDPRQAIFAQTRYLLRLYARFPSPDWIFQAYHGGEGGVQHTLKLYLGSAWPGSAAAAIRSGNSGGNLSYEEVYFGATPGQHRSAFGYLYGRSDDHRHYWWKLLASAQALAAYRRDPAGFHREWEGFLPGRMTDAWWYPQLADQSMGTLHDLWNDWRLHRYLPVASGRALQVRPAPLDAANAPLYAGLRPAALGALTLAARTYADVGGAGPLPVGDLALTRDYLTQARAAHPPKPRKPPYWPPNPDLSVLPGGGPPSDFDSHTVGISFDLLRPADETRRKVLEYALGCLEDRQIIAFTAAKDRDERRYHVVPNPAYGDALTRIALSGSAPSLSSL